jgi:hypothetical protein
MTLGFSIAAARVAGVMVPLFEACRRWNDWRHLSKWPFILDDFVMGGLLLFAAWKAQRRPSQGRLWLAAAWAFACGMMYGSFFGQLVSLAEPDPSGMAPAAMVTLKGLYLAVCVAGLVGALRPPVPSAPPGDGSG